VPACGHLNTHCNALQRTVTHCNTQRSVLRKIVAASNIPAAKRSQVTNEMQHNATQCNALRQYLLPKTQRKSVPRKMNAHYNSHETQPFHEHTALHCNALQLTAAHCNALQRTAPVCFAKDTDKARTEKNERAQQCAGHETQPFHSWILNECTRNPQRDHRNICPRLHRAHACAGLVRGGGGV